MRNSYVSCKVGLCEFIMLKNLSKIHVPLYVCIMLQYEQHCYEDIIA